MKDIDRPFFPFRAVYIREAGIPNITHPASPNFGELMEERKKRIAIKRTAKFKDLNATLEKERQAIRQRLKEESLQEKIYDDKVHQVISKLEEETGIDQPLRETIEVKKKENERESSERKEEPLEETPDTDTVSKANPVSKKPIKQTALVFLLLVSLVSGFFLYESLYSKTDAPIETQEETPNPMDPELRSMWLTNKKINEDYVGQIVFDSGLIDLPFVQAKDVYKKDGSLYTFYDKNGHLIEEAEGHTGNDVYIWTNWKNGKYDLDEEGGSVFLDYRNSLADPNLIIYGHHFARDYDPSGSRQFTPLDALLSKDNYEENRYLKLILDNEIRSYVVTNVFTINVYDEYEAQVIRTDFNEDMSGNAEPRFYSEFITYMNTISKYDTKELLNTGDRTLTLITCLQHQPEYRQVIICKEVEDVLYD